jgi:uncharacterized protein (TIGR03437 family)
VAASTSNFGVFFNGIAAPILYSSANQINLQVPYEIAGQSTVEMQLMSRETPLADSETITLAVDAQQPSVFLTAAAVNSALPAYTVCGGSVVFGVAAAALNADGTVNDCTNPARPGSTVTVFVNGMGQVTPALTTGAIAMPPAVQLSPGVTAVDDDGPNLAVATLTVPSAVEGIAQVQLQVPNVSPPLGAVTLVPALSGTVMRERVILIWEAPN